MTKLMEQHDYKIELDAEGYPTITLTELATGKVKLFPLRCSKGPEYAKSLARHMDSLTDDLCSSWFNQRERKKPKKEA